MENATVVSFLFGKGWDPLSQSLGIGSALPCDPVETPAELASYISAVDSCLVLASIKNKDDLAKLASMIKQTRSVAPKVPVKIMVVNFSRDPKIDTELTKLGVKDLIEPGITPKALRYKIDFMIRALNSQKQKVTTPEKVEVKKSQKVKDQSTVDSSMKGVEWLPQLRCSDDIWLIGKQDCKRIISKWLLKVTGPGPYFGQWVEERSSGTWKFTLSEASREALYMEDGNWFFKGDQKPEFVWKDNVWLITGGQFELYCIQGDKKFIRAQFKDKKLSVSGNSMEADSRLDVIRTSFDRSLTVKEEKKEGKDHYLEVEGSNSSNLKGKTDSNESDTGSLSGRMRSENSGHAPLSGKGETDIYDDSSMELELSPNEESPEFNDETSIDPAISGTLSGKLGASEQINDSDHALSVDPHFKGSELSMDADNEEIDGYLRGHQEHKQYGSKEIGKKQDSNSHSLPVEEGPEENEPGNLETMMENIDLNARIVQKGVIAKCEISDQFDDMVILSIDNSYITQGRPAIVQMKISYLGSYVDIKLRGLVTEVLLEEEMSFVTIQVIPEDIPEISKIMNVFEERQNNVLNFLRMVKGH